MGKIVGIPADCEDVVKKFVVENFWWENFFGGDFLEMDF